MQPHLIHRDIDNNSFIPVDFLQLRLCIIHKETPMR
jgi:hypothetical protein